MLQCNEKLLIPWQTSKPNPYPQYNIITIIATNKSRNLMKAHHLFIRIKCDNFYSKHIEILKYSEAPSKPDKLFH